jgi:hypothetical protein
VDTSPLAHPALAAAFAAFDRAGARWALLRGDVTLSDPDGDVDVLVDPADLTRVRLDLADVRFAEIPGRGYGTHRFFLAHHEPTDRWIKLDVFTELAFGRDFGLRTGAESACLDRRRRLGSVAVLAEEDAFWAGPLHALLDGDTSTRPEPRPTLDLVQKASSDGPLAAAVDAASPAGWSAARLAECARAGEWDALHDVTHALAARWHRRQGLPGARRGLLLRVRRGRDRLLRRWFHPSLWTAYVRQRASN